MALNLQSFNNGDEDDYIDMEITSNSIFFCSSIAISSPSHPREFEFQMSSNSQHMEPSTSPADELFYKGKLLPLHLPPRLQMVEKLLQNSNSVFDTRNEGFDEFFSTPLISLTPTTVNTPFESCNISPSESCRISRQMTSEDCLFDFSIDLSNGFDGENPKKSWIKKLNLMKESSSLGAKLKASKAYIKSLFGKSETKMAAKKNPFGETHSNKYQRSKEEEIYGSHRRSFSVSTKRHSINKSSPSGSCTSSSSSSSNNSNGFNDMQILRRSNSSNSEMESSILGAIAHCKQSQQVFRSRKTLSEVGYYSASMFAVCEDQERPEICRG